jgi:hypothetical protein
MDGTAALGRILEEEAALHEELLALLDREEASLLAGSGRVTAETLLRKEELLGLIVRAEERRRRAVEALGGRAGCRLRELPGADETPLREARDRLVAVLARVGAAAARVDVLLERTLGRLREVAALVHDALGHGPRYTAQGALRRPALPTLDGRA